LSFAEAAAALSQRDLLPMDFTPAERPHANLLSEGDDKALAALSRNAELKSKLTAQIKANIKEQQAELERVS